MVLESELTKSYPGRSLQIDLQSTPNNRGSAVRRKTAGDIPCDVRVTVASVSVLQSRARATIPSMVAGLTVVLITSGPMGWETPLRNISISVFMHLEGYDAGMNMNPAGQITNIEAHSSSSAAFRNPEPQKSFPKLLHPSEPRNPASPEQKTTEP